MFKVCLETGEACAYTGYCISTQNRINFPDLYPAELIDGQEMSELPPAITAAISEESCVVKRLDALAHLINNRTDEPRIARIAEGIAETIGYQRNHVAYR